MANRKITQFTAVASGAQAPTFVLPIVDPSLGSVAAANLKITLNGLFFDLGLNTSDGAVSMTGLLAAPSVSSAGKMKWYYNNSTKVWLTSIDAGAYYSMQRSIAAGLTATWLPYVDTGGILNGSANATLDGNGSLFVKFVTVQSALAGLNSVAAVYDSTGTDRWEIRLGASNQLIFQDFTNTKDVLTLTPGATPVATFAATVRMSTDNGFDIGLTNAGRPANVYIGTSAIIGRSSSTNGSIVFRNSSNTNTFTIQSGASAASRTYTWPTDFGAAGSVLTDAAGNGTLSWAVPSGTIGGSIVANQVAYGSGANTIQGSANLTYDGTTIAIAGTGFSALAFTGAGGGLTGSSAMRLLWSNSTSGITGSIDTGISRISAGLIGIGTGGAGSFAGDLRARAAGFGIAPASGTYALGVTPSASTEIGQVIKLAAAQTADALEVQNSSGTVLASITKDGYIGALVAGAAAAPAFAINTADTGFYWQNTSISVITATVGGTTSGCGFFNSGFVFGNNKIMKWSTNANPSSGTYDLGIAYNASGILEINNGTAGTFRDLRARYIGIGLAPTSGVLNIGGASQSGAYISVSTSSQVANDKLISVSMAGSITGLLYAADISMTATTGVLTRITNTENATNTSNCELRLVVGGSSAGDPFIHFNISGNTDWSIGARNTDSDNLTITAASDLSTSVILKVTTAGAFTVIDGSTWNVGTTTGIKIGTATTQKIGFWNVTPVVQPSTTGTAAGFTAGAGTNVTDQSTFTGGTGATAYRISDIVLALKQVGIMAA